MSYCWNFPMACHGATIGFNGSGTDDFLDDPLGNLAREAIQNSLDARRPGEMAVIEFSSFTSSKENFPGIQSYFYHLIDWQNSLTKSEGADEKEKRFVAKALNSMQGKQPIFWLRISDFNTFGMLGVFDTARKNSAWKSFTKMSGGSFKDDDSGGSKGLGKNAIFANSIFRTLFVSTYNTDGEKANIGIAKFCSVLKPDPNNPDDTEPDSTSGTGFCVQDNADDMAKNHPTNELLLLDPHFERAEGQYGSDLFVPGFGEGGQGWETAILGEAILSFLPAIMNGDIEIRVSGQNKTKIINKNNLGNEIDDKENFQKPSQQQQAKSYYRVLTSATPTFVCNDPGFEMKLFVREESEDVATNNAMAYRYPTKMKICAIKASSYVSYSAVLLIEGETLRKRLRSVEDVKHSRWAIARYANSGYTREEIKEAIDAVQHFVKSKMETYKMASTGDDADFDWARDEGWFDAEDGDSLAGEGQEDTGLATKSFSFEKEETTRARAPIKERGSIPKEDLAGETLIWEKGNGEEGAGDTIASHPSGHNPGDDHPDPHPGSNTINVGEGEEKMMIARPISTLNSKMPAIDPSKGLYSLLLTPAKSGKNIVIELNKIGVTGKREGTSVVSASCKGDSLKTKDSKIFMSEVVRGHAYRIDLEINEHRNFVWEVTVNANEKL